MVGKYLVGVDGFGSTGKDVVGAQVAYVITNPQENKNKHFVHADVGRPCRGSGLWLDDNKVRPENMKDNIHLINEIDYNSGEPKINGIVYSKERLDCADEIVALYMNAEGSLDLKKEKIWPCVANHMKYSNLLPTGREIQRKGAILDMAKIINPNLETMTVFFHGDLNTLAKWRAIGNGLTTQDAVDRIKKNLENRIERDVAGGQHPHPNSKEFTKAYDLTFDVTLGDIPTNVGRLAYEIINAFPDVKLNKRRAKEISQAYNKDSKFIENIVINGFKQ